MASLCKEGNLVETEMFNKMLERGVFPDHVMFILIARFLPKAGKLHSCRKHSRMLPSWIVVARSQWLLKYEFAAGRKAPS
jgi:pentatricopeptide repeat protein